MHVSILSRVSTVCIKALWQSHHISTMENEVVFRTALVSLAAVTVLTGLYTQSLKKTGGTYFFGMMAIGGVFLPDWKFFNRPVSQWCNVVEVRPYGEPASFKLYPVRVVIYTAVYGFGLYHWWNFIRRE